MNFFPRFAAERFHTVQDRFQTLWIGRQERHRRAGFASGFSDSIKNVLIWSVPETDVVFGGRQGSLQRFLRPFCPSVRIRRRRNRTLFFPECIGCPVISENKPEYFLYSFFLQGLLCFGNKAAGDSRPPEIRMNAQMVNDSPCARHALPGSRRRSGRP